MCQSVDTKSQTGRRNVVPTETRILASYNWSSTSRRLHPHIIVPGAPRKFVMSRRRFHLIKDGDAFVDENRSRMEPFSAMEPLFHSLGICSPEFDVSKVSLSIECRERDLKKHPYQFIIHVSMYQAESSLRSLLHEYSRIGHGIM